MNLHPFLPPKDPCSQLPDPLLLSHPSDLIWKITYVGSAESNAYDQVLEEVAIGPIVIGTYEFILEANAPDASRIPSGDLVGVTAVLVTCSYTTTNREPAEFIRIGYYVNVEYTDEALRENPPSTPDVAKLERYIIDDQPRVTRFNVPFDEVEAPVMGDDMMTEAGEEEATITTTVMMGTQL